MEAAYLSLKQQVGRRRPNELVSPKIQKMSKVFAKPDVVAVHTNKLMADETKIKVNKLINENHNQQLDCPEFDHYAQQLLIEETAESGVFLKLGTKSPTSASSSGLKLVQKNDSQSKSHTYMKKAKKG